MKNCIKIESRIRSIRAPGQPHIVSKGSLKGIASISVASAPREQPIVHAALIEKGEPQHVQEIERWPGGVVEGFWNWKGHTIRYLRCGSSGPPVLLVHGFGANACHWRKNLPIIGQSCTVYAIDLLGYGYSSKPSPKSRPPNAIYNFENWSAQIRDFIEEKMGGHPTALICNSVGGIAGLQAAIDDSSSLIKAVQVINISLRMLHINKQAPWQRPLVKALQNTLRETSLGSLFFNQIATKEGVNNVLRQCYHNKAAVTDELVEIVLRPGLQPGAVDVFLDFISYSDGPLPEQLLSKVDVPVSVLWGDKDPWEKVEWGREFAKYSAVEEFVELENVGHCPMDEAPHLVNPISLAFINRHFNSK